MATGRINKSGVDALQPAAKDIILWDDKLSGFGLKVTPAGAKTYLFQYRLGGRSGKTRRVTIGKHGAFTPDAARRAAESFAQMVGQGIDPQRQKKDAARKAVDLAFKSYAASFVDDCLKVRWKSSHQMADSLLRMYATPVLGSKPLHDITRADIRAVLNQSKGKVATTRYLFAVLRRLFRWAVSQGDLDRSPISGMEPPPMPAARDRVLSDDELVLVWNAAGKLGYPFGPFVRLLIATGQRLDEVSQLDWSELDKAGAMWVLPAERTKNSVASMVPLSSLAIDELNALAKRSNRKDGWPRTGYVFSTTGKTAISGHSRAKRRLDKEIATALAATGLPPSLVPWRFHDLRRTLATGLQRLGVRFEVTEAVLNHVSGSKSGVAGVYQRHDWAEEKKAALHKWSDHVAGLLTPSDKTNVVALASRRA